MKPTQTLDLNGISQRNCDIAEWLTNTCDTIVWSNYGRQPLIPGLLRPWETHSQFKAAVEKLRNEQIDTYTDTIEYGHLDHSRMKFRHYRFRIDGPVRQVLLREGPLLSFPGLWDPCYYRADELVAAGICHEGSLLLWEVSPR